jgi:hypothetical protein
MTGATFPLVTAIIHRCSEIERFQASWIVVAGEGRVRHGRDAAALNSFADGCLGVTANH